MKIGDMVAIFLMFPRFLCVGNFGKVGVRCSAFKRGWVIGSSRVLILSGWLSEFVNRDLLGWMSWAVRFGLS